MDNRERMDMIVNLTKDLRESVDIFEQAKESANGRPVYGGCQVFNKDSATAIHRKITLIREQLITLSRKVKA